MASLQESTIYKKNCETFGEPSFISKMDGKTGREIIIESQEKVKKKGLSKIPEFWRAKYRCILMGVVLFFSIAEIIMFNVNNFLQGESTKSIMQKLVKKYLANSTSVIQHNA